MLGAQSGHISHFTPPTDGIGGQPSWAARHMRPSASLVLRSTLVLLSSLPLVQAWAGPGVGIGPAIMPPDAGARTHPVKGPALPADAAVAIELDGEVDQDGQQRSMASQGPGPVKIGYERAIAALDDPKALSQRQAWLGTRYGGVASAFAITSPGARALRLGMWVQAMPDRARLRFFAPGAQEVIEITGAEVNASLRRNLQAGDSGMEAETFWSPLIEGETITLEVELPPDIAPNSLVIAVPRLSHIYELPYGPQGGVIHDGVEKAAASCHKDVMCYPDWDPQSKATARMLYTKNGGTYFCTGTLLNDSDAATYIPYFLTANHCISTQSVASSLMTYWFWRSTYCNSGAPGSFQSLSGGADLLYVAAKTDTTFLRLSQTPPSGAIFAGWRASLPAQGQNLTGVHHPQGDLQKISLGASSGFWHCLDGSAGSIY